MYVYIDTIMCSAPTVRRAYSFFYGVKFWKTNEWCSLDAWTRVCNIVLKADLLACYDTMCKKGPKPSRVFKFGSILVHKWHWNMTGFFSSSVSDNNDTFSVNNKNDQKMSVWKPDGTDQMITDAIISNGYLRNREWKCRIDLFSLVP